MSSIREQYADKFNLNLFESLHLANPWTMDTYRQIGGYQSWEKILAGGMTQEQVIDQVKASGLRGRGGAGFPDGHEVELHATHLADPEVRGMQLG